MSAKNNSRKHKQICMCCNRKIKEFKLTKLHDNLYICFSCVNEKMIDVLNEEIYIKEW